MSRYPYLCCQDSLRIFFENFEGTIDTQRGERAGIKRHDLLRPERYKHHQHIYSTRQCDAVAARTMVGCRYLWQITQQRQANPQHSGFRLWGREECHCVAADPLVPDLRLACSH